MNWFWWAFSSAFFAGITAILAKIGVTGVDSDLATAVSTTVILYSRGASFLPPRRSADLLHLNGRNWVFLVLSGFATGLSWICYFRALQLGEASRVAPVDKLSVVFAIAFAALILREHLGWQQWLGGGLDRDRGDGADDQGVNGLSGARNDWLAGSMMPGFAPPIDWLLVEMSTEITLYRELLGDIKTRVRQAQHKAMLSANAEMILMYWDIGRMIAARQEREGWGAGVIPRLAVDLKNELPEEKGFSDTNLKRMVQFSREYPTLFPIGARPVAKLPPLPELPSMKLLIRGNWGTGCAPIGKGGGTGTNGAKNRCAIELGSQRHPHTETETSAHPSLVCPADH